MSSELRDIDVQTSYGSVHVATGGVGRPLVLLHGGLPGFGTYAGKSCFLRPFAERLMASRQVILIDLPGSGASSPINPDDAYLTQATGAVADVLRDLAIDSADVLTHGESALVAMRMARSPETSALIASCVLVSPVLLAPIGDSLDPVTLLHPPVRLGARAQWRWLLDSLSFSEAHIDRAFLDELSSDGVPPAESLTSDPARTVELLGEKVQIFAHARDHGFDVPICLIWGTEDRLISREQGIGLWQALSKRDTVVDIHLINNSGHFPTRERPDDVERLMAPALATSDGA